MKDNGKTITTAYNVALFAFLFIFQTIKTVLEYKEEQDMFIDKLFDNDVFIGLATVLLLFIASSTVGVWIIKSFWERFISQIFQVRTLTVNEAISIALVLLIFSIN